MSEVPSQKQPAEIQESLHYQVTHDELTGLLNKRGFDEELHKLELTQPGEFGLMVIDLDGMKEINDTKGHEAGNELLKETAEVIKSTIRHNRTDKENDVLAKENISDPSEGARDGGDEFKVLLVGVANDSELEAVTKRLRDNFTTAGISASIGSKVHEKGEPSEELKEAADKRMYADKQTRRLEAHTEEQQNVARQIGQMLVESGMNARNLAGLLEALEYKDQAA